MSASQYNETIQVNPLDLRFPVAEDLVNYTTEIQPLVAKIPLEVIQERLQIQDGGKPHAKFYLLHGVLYAIVDSYQSK